MTDDLQILIVDNNEAHRALLSKVVNYTEGAEVAGTASSGKIAMAKLKQFPVDLVLLEIDMPLMDGLMTLEKLRKSHPDVGVVVVGGSRTGNAENVIKALQMGALDFISKFGMDDDDRGIPPLRRRLMTLIGLFRARRNTRLAKQLYCEGSALTNTARSQDIPGPAQPALEPSVKTVPLEVEFRKPLVANPKVELVAIGVSTGGPNALSQLIPLLPADLGVPVLLVQHMPAALTGSLAYSLNRRSALPVREAIHGEEVLPNIVYVASGGAHMVVKRQKATPATPFSRRIGLTSDPPVNSCRPSVDVLFQSIAESYDGTTLAVIMTGMGSDGKDGVRMLKRIGCYCLAQTEDTCVVYGMPRAVVEAGLSDETVPLHQMAQRIVEIVRGQNPRVK